MLHLRPTMETQVTPLACEKFWEILRMATDDVAKCSFCEVEPALVVPHAP